MDQTLNPVIIQLNGGLGNQMFQYAFGRALALKRHAPLFLDLRAFKNDPLRDYALNTFNLQAREADEKLLVRYKPSLVQKIWAKLKLPGSLNSQIYAEKEFCFDPKIALNNKAQYFIGYWQTEKYFAGQETEIRRDFEIKPEYLVGVQDFLKAMQNTDSISLHIRRGDYVSNSHTNTFHGVCSMDYYQKALNLALEGTTNPHLYIFTDDPEWARKETTWPVPTVIVSGQGLTDIQEFYLMTQVKKNIIANSSFSWWAAWLNSKAQVFCPAKWFGNAGHDTKDLIPERWIKVGQ